MRYIWSRVDIKKKLYVYGIISVMILATAFFLIVNGVSKTGNSRQLSFEEQGDYVLNLLEFMNSESTVNHQM